MPRPPIEALNAKLDLNELVECPCGERGSMRELRIHRFKAKRYKWPCWSGKLAHLGVQAPTLPPEPATLDHQDDDASPAANDPDNTHHYPSQSDLYVWPGRDLEEDPEEAARRYNLQRFPPPPPASTNGNGHANLPPGVLVEEPATGPPAVSRDRLAVTLPVGVKVYYDWARDHGWKVGSGSLDTFVEDILFTHFAICMDLAIFVGYKSELGVR